MRRRYQLAAPWHYRIQSGGRGLVDALGEEIAGDLRRRLQPLSGPDRPASYQDLAERMMLGFLEAVRSDPLTQKIMAWEIADPSPLVQRLTMVRSKSMMAWVAQMRGDLAAPTGVDVAASNAVLLAAIQHLALSSAATGQFAGLALQADADWDRVRKVIRTLVAAIYA